MLSQVVILSKIVSFFGGNPEIGCYMIRQPVADTNNCILAVDISADEESSISLVSGKRNLFSCTFKEIHSIHVEPIGNIPVELVRRLAINGIDTKGHNMKIFLSPEGQIIL